MIYNCTVVQYIIVSQWGCVCQCVWSKTYGGWWADEKEYWSQWWWNCTLEKTDESCGRNRKNKCYKKENWNKVEEGKRGGMHTSVETLTLVMIPLHLHLSHFQHWQLALWWIGSREHTIEVSTSPFPPLSLHLSPISHCFHYPNSHLSGLVCSPAAVLKHPSLLCLSLPSLLSLFPSLCFLLKHMWRSSDSISVQALSPVRQRGFISPSPRRFPLFIARHHLLRDSSLCRSKRAHLYVCMLVDVVLFLSVRKGLCFQSCVLW